MAVKLGKPWVYGGAIGSHGQTMTIMPGETPCLRCVFEAAPAPGEAGTCETAGVLAPAVNIVASFQATEAIKLLTGQQGRDQPRAAHHRRVGEHEPAHQDRAARGRKVDCPCCAQRKFEWLDGAHGTQTTSLCGRNAVQVAHRAASKLNFEDLAGVLKQPGTVSFNQFLLKFNLIENGDPYEFTVFPDGRAIIKGTERRGQGPDAVREVRRALIGYDGTSRTETPMSSAARVTKPPKAAAPLPPAIAAVPASSLYCGRVSQAGRDRGSNRERPGRTH